MNASSQLHQDDRLETVFWQNQLLDYFSKIEGARLTDLSSQWINGYYFRAWDGEIDGFGHASTKRLAIVKAISELFEHRFMMEAFKTDLRHISKWLQTSNGFAVHFDRNVAEKAAIVEAYERHILQLTYLLKGWDGFELLSDTNIKGVRVRRIISKFQCDSFRAGMVLATGDQFPGVSFGYLCDDASEIFSSNRWAHAEGEALGKIEPWMALRLSDAATFTPIERELHKWLFGDRFGVEFRPLGKDFLTLPKITPHVRLFDLTRRWNLPFSFFASFCEGLLPMLVPGRIHSSDQSHLSSVLEHFDIKDKWTGRNPIL